MVSLRTFVLISCLGLGACAARGPESGVLPAPEAIYRAAVRDAAVAEPWEVSRRLRAIVPQEPGIFWQGEPGSTPVLVVAWVVAELAEALVETLPEGAPGATPEELWVTLAPDLEQACRPLRPAQRDRRLQQLLGLPPGEEQRVVLELWVPREVLFRPCPDPEVTDHECELNFPHPDSRVTISDAHRRWFEALQERIYDDGEGGEGAGRPWTRLGYTYHWGHRKGEEGLSEFVIPAGAPVTVRRAASTAEYCQSR